MSKRKVSNQNSILEQIDKVFNDEVKLYSLLYDLIYEEKENDVTFLRKLYESFLKDDRSEIKRIAIYAILFGLKIKNNKFLDIALSELSDDSADIHMRLTCVSSLASAYFSTDEKQILSVFEGIYFNDKEDDNLRTECFLGILKVQGLTSSEIVIKNGGIVVELKDIDTSVWF